MRLPRLPNPTRGLDGLPVVGRLERRLSWVVVAVATGWFAMAAAWGLFGPLLAGHYASSASMGIIAENMLRWRIAGPVWEYTTQPPQPSAYYCNHPWGIFWTTAAAMKVFGRYDFVCRLPAVLLSVATPPLLFAIGRALWRPAAGAAAAAAFVVLPICLAFAHFNALEVPVMAWSLVGVWGFVRHTQTQRRRYLAASVIGFVLAMHADWPAYVLVGELLLFGLLRGFVFSKWPFGRTDLRAYTQWWALTASAAVATALLYAYLFHDAGKLDDLIASSRMRSAGAGQSLAKVLAKRHYWLELSFTPIAIVLGKLAAVVCALRLVLRRYEHEVIPLALLGMATFQYLVFKQGADIHVFWPHYFGVFFALGMGALVATGIALGDGIVRWRRQRRCGADRTPSVVPLLAALGVSLAVSAAILRDGVPALAYARGTGGRFNEKGLLIHSDGAKTAFLRWLEPQLPSQAVVAMHIGMKATWAQTWALGGRVVRAPRPVPKAGRGDDVYLADTRFLYDELQAGLVRSHHVVAVGPFWRLLRAEDPAPIDAYRFAEREPTWLEWYWQSGTEPQREVEPDPFATWQLRVHFGQSAEVPTEAPTTLGERTIAHNVALHEGDEGAAAQHLQAVRQAVRPLDVEFDDGTTLVGVRYESGARPSLALVMHAAGPAEQDVQLAVQSRVVARAPLSTTMADPVTRDVGIPLGLSPRRWREGFLYTHRIPIRQRPGTEVFEASFKIRTRGRRARARAPQPVGAVKAPVEVLRLR